MVQAQCTKNIIPLLSRAKRAVLVSGTPAMSKPAELMPQLRGLLPSYKFTNAEFAERYCEGDKFDSLKGSKNLPELNMVLVSCLALSVACFYVLVDVLQSNTFCVYGRQLFCSFIDMTR